MLGTKLITSFDNPNVAISGIPINVAKSDIKTCNVHPIKLISGKA